MNADLAVIYRPRRRAHFSHDGSTPLCGTVTGTADIVRVHLDAAGGATPRLVRQLSLVMNDNTCKRCARLAGIVALMYSVRDTGKVMRSW